MGGEYFLGLTTEPTDIVDFLGERGFKPEEKEEDGECFHNSETNVRISYVLSESKEIDEGARLFKSKKRITALCHLESEREENLHVRETAVEIQNKYGGILLSEKEFTDNAEAYLFPEQEDFT